MQTALAAPQETIQAPSPAQAIKQAAVDHPIHPLLSGRWSPRAFDGRAVEPESLLSLLEAARWSASASNRQPWHFFIAQRGDAAFAALAGVLNPSNAEWAANAPVLLLAVARTVTDDGRPNPYGFYDTGLAVQNLTVQATALGLHVHQMGGFAADRARLALAIPPGYDPVIVAAIGYLGDPAMLEERRREAELTPRVRKPLSEFVFGKTWGEPPALVE
jgi:nitroreductase